jgi:prophage regulatory protein
VSTGSLIPVPQAPTVLIGRNEVLRRAGLKKSTLYVLIAKGKFPRQVQKTFATVGWIEAEVEAWILEREALRPGPSAEKGAGVRTKPIARPTSPSVKVLSWPEGTPTNGQLQPLNAEQITQLLGRGSSRPKVVEPQYFYDSASGTLWLRVLKV